ncbi:MAG: aminotransferase class I/II-fold pyridoxal phosphate-dependent enzyme [Acidimicrobiia bacterium]
MSDPGADLAHFGGRPAFAEPVHVGRPNIGDRRALQARLDDILDRRWLTNAGRYVREFEDRLARLLGVSHCIATCNGTVALELVTRALGLEGEVILPSFTFVATAHALQWQQITPVFCDVDPTTHNLDPKRVEEMITPRTTGIIGVHVWGRPCDTDALSEIAHRRGLRLLFDAAHALGCSSGGTPVGGFGEAEVFSFHATKIVNAFEGGAVATNDEELAGELRLMKNFGFSGYDDVTYIGTNGKMNEASAAMGVTSLESFEHFRAVNLGHYEHYRDRLGGIDGVDVVEHPTGGADQANYHYVVLELDESRLGISRDMVMELLRAENILARRYFYPGCHRMEPYRSLFPHAGLLVPETEQLVRRVLCLPTGESLSETDIDRICDRVSTIAANGSAIAARLAS